MKRSRSLVLAALLALTVLLTAACGSGNGPSGTTSQLTGTVLIDGSSTVFPITEAVAEEFQIENRGVRVTVGVSGTGGGFKKFTRSEIAISNASRPIKDSEVQAAREHNVEYIELPVAFDGLSVVVNKANAFVDCLTMAELRQIWAPGSKVNTWRDVRAAWPAEAIKLFGPGTDSGTFDYFTEEVNGESGASRSDYTASEDDNVLVQGIAGSPGALGYFGYAYYVENQDTVKVVGIDAGKGCIKPTDETINQGTYPLARPIYIYVNTRDLNEKPEVAAFVKYYLTAGVQLVPQVGYIKLPEQMYKDALAKVEAALK